jgi:hypothetical protein
VKDELRYRLIDEPRPNFLSRLAIPPMLAFIAATFFQPWGYLLLVYNAIALNGPQRNREIGLSLLPFPLFYGAIALLDGFVRADTLTVNRAHYFFVMAVGVGLASAAFAFISQSRTFELRRYLAELRGYSA